MQLVAVTSDEAAFRELFDRYWPRVRAFLRSAGTAAAEAEDLAQETFLSIVRYRHTYKPGRSFVSWLFQIARNASARSGRSRSARQDGMVADAPLDTLPAAHRDPDRVTSRETAQLIEDALATLDDTTRQIVALRIREDWTFGEIAEAVELGEDAARKRFKAGLGKLRERLAQQGFP
jgi:RNA polymerase sigma-70 factor (ECF subfamily)